MKTIQTVAAQKIAFEQRYSDDSGVEYAVRYDTTQGNNRTAGPTIVIEAINTVCFPIEELDWLIACLDRIRAETALNAGAKP